MQTDQITSDDCAPEHRHFIFDDMLVYPGDSLNAFNYLPLRPSPVLTDSGNPSGQLLAAGERSYLMLAAQWDVAASRLELLRAHLAASDEMSAAQAPAPIRLSFAPVRDVEAALLVKGTDALTPLAHSRTSQMPPYSAMFSLPLEGDARDAALKAMSGHRDALWLSFQGALSAPLAVEGRFEGDFSDVHDAAALHAAMENGRVAFSTTAPASASFIDQLCARVLELLPATAAGQGRHVINVRLDFAETIDISAAADIGDWFADTPAVLPSP